MPVNGRFVWRKFCYGLTLLAILFLPLTVSAASAVLPPSKIHSPEPLPDARGKFMSPYTSDGVIAPWVEKSMNARAGAAIGSALGAYAGQKLFEQVPLVGGFLGSKVGKKIGRSATLAAVGGEEFLRSSSDLSFMTIDDLAVYMYANYGRERNYQKVLKAVQEIYPEMKTRYYPALRRASARSFRMGGVVAQGGNSDAGRRSFNAISGSETQSGNEYVQFWHELQWGRACAK